jgi:hypothetical protein
MSWVMDPLPSFQIYKSTSLMFLHFVIPDAAIFYPLPKKVLGLKIKDFDKNLNEIKVCCGSI